MTDIQSFARTITIDGKEVKAMLAVDVQSIIAKLARRALRSQSKSSAFMDGRVVVRVTSAS